MSFQKSTTYKIDSNRKERDSHRAKIKHFHHIFRKNRGRASVFTSKGGLSLEAALVIPIFFFAVLCFVFLFEMMAIRISIKNGLYSTGRELSEQAYTSTMISTPAIRQHIVNYVGEERLNRSMIVGGAAGIYCGDSVSNWQTGVLNLSVRYTIEIPVLMFRIPAILCEETLRVKGWTGYAKLTDTAADDVVYVTDWGEVYHRDMACTYLDVDVRGIIANTIQDARNDSGGKYYPCESCKKQTHCGILYVTNYGNRYHTSLNCKKIKRNIYAISKQDVLGMGGCSKCVK